jgi:hypothetical protein
LMERTISCGVGRCRDPPRKKNDIFAGSAGGRRKSKRIGERCCCSPFCSFHSRRALVVYTLSYVLDVTVSR